LPKGKQTGDFDAFDRLQEWSYPLKAGSKHENPFPFLFLNILIGLFMQR
jgi:hypothetical protein